MKTSFLSTAGFLFADRVFYYGEWSVWHSNLPKFLGPNKVMVNLFPEDELQISHKKYVGPFLLEKKWKGHYNLFTNTEDRDTHNLSPTQRDCVGIVNIIFREKEHVLVSLFGIGVDEIPLTFLRSDSIPLTMDLRIVGNNDMYLTVSNTQLQKFLARSLPVDKTTSYHLVRSIQNDQPKINVPLSTLLATQLFSMIMGYLLHTAPPLCHDLSFY